ncbi:unnamed protein product [marine sediment metagenome]|uniref:DNA primase/polymerase bifunctional N-terminal domain-containing protein n=1 Tax=marine sediment metagenome TaxID=412755 RepID=X1R2D2_9ZZZZ
MKGLIQIINIRIVSEYYQKGYTPIPLKNNSKFPIIKWKQYQSERASLKETLHWFVEFKEPNLGLVTGRELIVIDLDDIEKLPELKKILPEIDSTTRVKTKRPGYHFYFSNDGHKIRSADNLFSLEKVNLFLLVARDQVNYKYALISHSLLASFCSPLLSVSLG